MGTSLAVAPPRTPVAAGVSVGRPTILAIILAVVATVLQVVQEIVLKNDPQWQAYIGLVLIFLAAEAIKPLTGGSGLSTLLHVPQWLSTLLTAFALALGGALQVIHMTTGAHVVVLAGLTLLAALGYGGANEPIALPAIAPTARTGSLGSSLPAGTVQAGVPYRNVS